MPRPTTGRRTRPSWRSPLTKNAGVAADRRRARAASASRATRAAGGRSQGRRESARRRGRSGRRCAIRSASRAARRWRRARRTSPRRSPAATRPRPPRRRARRPGGPRAAAGGGTTNRSCPSSRSRTRRTIDCAAVQYGHWKSPYMTSSSGASAGRRRGPQSPTGASSIGGSILDSRAPWATSSFSSRCCSRPCCSCGSPTGSACRTRSCSCSAGCGARVHPGDPARGARPARRAARVHPAAAADRRAGTPRRASCAPRAARSGCSPWRSCW